MNTISHFNPISGGFREAIDHFRTLCLWQKTAVVIASVVGGAFSFYILFKAAFAAVQYTIKRLYPSSNQYSNLVNGLLDAPNIFNSVILPPCQRNKQLITPRTDFAETTQLLQSNSDLFSNERFNPELHYGFVEKLDLEPGSRVFVCGSIDGDLDSLLNKLTELQRLKLLDANFACKKDVHMVFLGNYCDSVNEKSLEVLNVLLKLRLNNPERVHLLRGDTDYVGNSLSKKPTNTHTDIKKSLLDPSHQTLLKAFYQTLCLSLYISQSSCEKKEYVQFTHGLFELKYDPSPILDSPNSKDSMCIPVDLKMSERIQTLPCNHETDYETLIATEEDANRRKRYKREFAAKRIHQLIKDEDRNLERLNERSSIDGRKLTSFTRGKVSESTLLLSLICDAWFLSRSDIKQFWKVSSTENKVKKLIKSGKRSVSSKDQSIVLALSNVNDARLLEVAPKVKNWNISLF